MESIAPLWLWLALQRWPKCFLLGGSRGLGFGFGNRCSLSRFGLHRFEAQDLTVPVTLVQGFELVDEGRGTVSFEAFISKMKEIMTTSVWMYKIKCASTISPVCILTLSYRWLFPHQSASFPHLKTTKMWLMFNYSMSKLKVVSMH